MGHLNLTSGLFFPFAFELLKVTWFNPGRLRAECRYSLLPQASSINYKWSRGHFEMLHLLATAATVVAAAAAAKCSDSPGQSDPIYNQIEGLRCWQGHSELKVMTSPPLKGWRLFVTWQPRPPAPEVCSHKLHQHISTCGTPSSGLSYNKEQQRACPLDAAWNELRTDGLLCSITPRDNGTKSMRPSGWTRVKTGRFLHNWRGSDGGLFVRVGFKVGI